MPAVYQTRSDEETQELAARLASGWPRAGVVLLIGNLGAGKTTFAKGVASGLGVARADDVSSPTFPLIHEYGDPVQIYHVDLYRLETIAEVETLGLREIFDRGALVVMEWAERFPSLLPPERIEVRITATSDDSREITVTEVR